MVKPLLLLADVGRLVVDGLLACMDGTGGLADAELTCVVRPAG